MDFRLYLAESFQSNDALLGALFNPPKQTEDLELIILRVTHRPDGRFSFINWYTYSWFTQLSISGYTMPSLASLFPFLEAIRPNDCPSWHIHRAQQLKYEPVWVLYSDQGDRHGNKEVESLSIVSIYGRDLIDVDMLKTGQGCFFLLLLPRSWAIEEPNSKVLAICSQLLIPGKSGTIIKKVEFDQYWYYGSIYTLLIYICIYICACTKHTNTRICVYTRKGSVGSRSGPLRQDCFESSTPI